LNYLTSESIMKLNGRIVGILVMWTLAAVSHGAEKYTLHTFEKTQLSDQFFSEGANFGDFNHDGIMDIVSGPYWYAGPKFTERHEYYPAVAFDIAKYSENFFAFTYDVNRDGWTDIVIIGFPGKEAWWFENPHGKKEAWERHVMLPHVDDESPTFTDVTGDGVPELVCANSGQLGYAEIPKDGPTKQWTFHAVTPKRDYQRFTHGLGVGDVNGDGRQDLLEKDGWWEQPSPGDKAELWKFHPVQFSEGGGSQMYAFDVNGDRRNDVVTCKAAHAYGLSWFENLGETNGEIKFKEHQFMGEKPEENEYGVAFSQMHAIATADMDHDGVPDIITGKRFWAHAEHDPGSLDPAVLYWFKTVRDHGKVRFIPYRIDSNSGVGTQVVVGDLNGDGWADIVVGNKKGTFVFIHKAKDVDRRTWEAAQPMPTQPRPPQPTGGVGSHFQSPAVSDGSDRQLKMRPDPISNDGFPATAADGRALNLDFEKGDLSDWTATGTAFRDQPIEGDTVHARRGDSVSGHRGRYWVGTYERSGDGPQGTLTSVPFPVTHPYASFLVGGGAGGAMRVEIVRADRDKVIFSAGGRSVEEMRPAVADLHKDIGKQIYVRLVDYGSAGWGHINFDHFRFHDKPPPVTNAAPEVGTADVYPYAGLPAEEAARVMKLPPGFSVKVAAEEPDVKQPIAMALDDRGRLWVAEAYTYPIRAAEGKGRDRILIFEDTDGDGKFDKRKVFIDGLNLVSGLEVGFGGVYVGAAPYLLFISDRNGDDIPDGKPEVLLDGWAYEDTHETLNTFTWGPDGWLYGCHGVFTHSNVGKPGAAKSERIPINAGIWRYHPTRQVFEVFAEGTSNPWGIDFDEHGQAFCTACVIPHLFHIIQGARYQRQAGEHLDPFTYADIQTIADHRHYVGASPHAGNGRSSDAGGGHAHAGALIYQGGVWPDEYRQTILMNNIHGQRVNSDILERQGSGFVGHHGKDFLLTGDLASQMLNFRYGPDGQVYINDWYDMNACHHTNPEGHDRTNGRIYKVCYGKTVPKQVDLQKKSDRDLAEMVLSKNDWYVQHARRILQERAAAGAIDPSARERLLDIIANNHDETRRLRAMWALHVTGGLPEELSRRLLSDANEYVRGWVVQLSLDKDRPQLAELFPEFAAMAARDASNVVRLYLASAMQRVPSSERWAILERLASHAEDASDHNLPLMYWYAAEPLAEADPERALAFGLSCGKTISLLREFMLRRIGSLEGNSGVPVLVTALGKSIRSDEQLTILRAVRAALAGQRKVKAPSEWATVYRAIAKSESEDLRNEATALGVTFGDADALETMRRLVASPQTDAAPRRNALKALLAAKDPQIVSTLYALLGEPALREIALAGLAMYDDPHTPAKILAAYPGLNASEKRSALATLSSRAPYGIALLSAVAASEVPKTDLSADLIRQLHNLHNEEIDELLNKTWGQVRSTAADKKALIATYRTLLKKKTEQAPDPMLGRAVFARTCQQCHTLYGVGANIGPDLTGSNRADMEYLLTNIVDPSALIAKEYQPTIFTTTDGRVITGIVSAENDKSVTVRTATETIILPKNEIDERKLSSTSMMPEDQLKQFTTHEILSLFSYLRGKSQVPMLATKENASSFFNGHDLAGWTGAPRLWSVEIGQIVGRSPGIGSNTFLLSDLAAENFRLSLDVKLVNDEGNSGVQFRSEPLNGFNEMRGYQADIGTGWWGKLYEENGRAILSNKSGEPYLKKGDWNHYEIDADGSHIRTWLNDNPCVDINDTAGKSRGQFALQLHAGGPTEVRFRNIKLEIK
jgi:putative membrane-bound dehydrogenase-like protein